MINEVRAAGITHVVTTTDKDVTSLGLKLVYEDESYRVYRVVAHAVTWAEKDNHHRVTEITERIQRRDVIPICIFSVFSVTLW